MNEAGITLSQVLLLGHLERSASLSPSGIAEAMHASLPAASQMIERLVQQGLLDRTDDPHDGRRKLLTATAYAHALMKKLSAARSMEYEIGLSSVSNELLARATTVIDDMVAELEGQSR